jgi:hypothetical protein
MNKIICDVIQKKSDFSASFEIISNGSATATALLKNNFTFGGTWEYYQNNKLEYKLIYNPQKQFSNLFKPASKKVSTPYNITDENGNICGYIHQKQTGGNIFERYDYFVLNLNDASYNLYPIGMGKNGNKLPIYKGDKQISLIEKDNTVYNNLDKYHITSIGNEENLVACLFALYIDSLIYSNRGKKVTRSIMKSYNLTTNKELLSKYDESFINKEELTK